MNLLSILKALGIKISPQIEEAILTATILCSIPNCTSGVNTVFNPATPPSEPVPSN